MHIPPEDVDNITGGEELEDGFILPGTKNVYTKISDLKELKRALEDAANKYFGRHSCIRFGFKLSCLCLAWVFILWYSIC